MDAFFFKKKKNGRGGGTVFCGGFSRAALYSEIKGCFVVPRLMAAVVVALTDARGNLNLFFFLFRFQLVDVGRRMIRGVL